MDLKNGFDFAKYNMFLCSWITYFSQMTDVERQNVQLDNSKLKHAIDKKRQYRITLHNVFEENLRGGGMLVCVM